jgi:hypothetical protein
MNSKTHSTESESETSQTLLIGNNNPPPAAAQPNNTSSPLNPNTAVSPNLPPTSHPLFPSINRNPTPAPQSNKSSDSALPVPDFSLSFYKLQLINATLTPPPPPPPPTPPNNLPAPLHQHQTKRPFLAARHKPEPGPQRPHPLIKIATEVLAIPQGHVVLPLQLRYLNNYTPE